MPPPQRWISVVVASVVVTSEGDGMTIIDRSAVTGSPIERARALAPLIEASALDGEHARKVPDAVFDAIREAGLLRLYLPEALGGLEVDPLTMLEVVETLSATDGSTGWVTMILNGAFMLAWVDPASAKQLVDDTDGDVVLAGMFAPLGRGVPDGDGFRLTGRWPFNSGSSHANWSLGGTFVMDGDRPATRDGHPDWRFMVFPASEMEIHDTWRAAGLRATSSHDVSVDDIRVPAELAPAPIFDRARHDGPLWRFTFFALLGTCIVGCPLGIARRALDDTVTMCETKSRDGGRSTLLADSSVQLELIRAEGALRAARSLAIDAIGGAWERARRGDEMSIQDRIAVRLAVAHAAEVGVRVVDTCFRLGGGGALYEHSPLQRCWRDIHAATHHVFFADHTVRDFARVHFGLDQDALTM